MHPRSPQERCDSHAERGGGQKDRRERRRAVAAANAAGPLLEARGRPDLGEEAVCTDCCQPGLQHPECGLVAQRPSRTEFRRPTASDIEMSSA